MSKKKENKTAKDTSSVKDTHTTQKEMKPQEKCDIFHFAALALVIAVCVVPLTAEMSICKYSECSNRD